MTFWDWLDRRMLSERQWVTLATYVLAASMLKMAEVHQELWQVELFKTLLTLVVGTGIVNMILALHFSANRNDEARAANTGKMADAFRAVAENAAGAGPGSNADARAEAADETAEAARAKADQIADRPEGDTFPLPPADDDQRI